MTLTESHLRNAVLHDPTDFPGILHRLDLKNPTFPPPVPLSLSSFSMGYTLVTVHTPKCVSKISPNFGITIICHYKTELSCYLYSLSTVFFFFLKQISIQFHEGNTAL